MINANNLINGDDDRVAVWPQETIAELIQKTKEKLEYGRNLLLQMTGRKQPKYSSQPALR